MGAERVRALAVRLRRRDGPFGDPSLDSVGSRQSAEVDGYRYELEVTQTVDEYSVTYTLTDIATGEIVVTESADGLSDEEDPVRVRPGRIRRERTHDRRPRDR